MSDKTPKKKTTRMLGNKTANVAPITAGREAQPPRWRKIVATVLLVLGCLLAPFAIASFWLNRQVVDTNAYVETVAPLSKDPEIQKAVANFATVELFSLIDEEKMAREALPPQARFLAGPITESVRGFARDTARKVVASPQFSKVWIKANRVAHNAIVSVLLGKGKGATVTESGKVDLNLGAMLGQVSNTLKSSGIDILGKTSLKGSDIKITVFQSRSIAAIRQGVDFLNRLAVILPILVFGFLGAAIAVSPARRRTFLWIGLGLVIAMAAMLLGLNIGRAYYLNAVASNLFPREAAAAIFDTLVRSLRTAGRTVFVLGLVAMIGAVLAGPSPSIVRLRESLGKGIRSFGAELDFGPVGTWIARHKTVLRGAGLLLALIALVFWEQPTPFAVIGIAAVFLIYLAVIEFFGREPGAAAMERAAGQAKYQSRR